MGNEKINSVEFDFDVFVTSHKGRVRENNEDNFALNTISKKLEYENVSFQTEMAQPFIAAVFDGMGGEEKGEYASLIAAAAAKELYRKVCEYSDCKFDALANNYVTLANNNIRDFMTENHAASGGSTVAAVIVKNGIAYPFSLGDSRIYLLNSGGLTQISRDHTLAQRKFEEKIYSREEADRSPDSHKLTLFLGADYYKQGLEAQNYEPLCLKSGEALLLCSDGLYDELTRGEIESVMLEHSGNPAYELVKAALKSGGGDNVTCAVIIKK